MIETLPVTTLASIALGPVQFDAPWWLVLFPLLAVATVWLGRRGISGLGARTRVLATGARLLVLALLVGALAEPQSRETSDRLSVTVVMDESRSVPGPAREGVDAYLREAATGKPEREDALGVITTAQTAYVQALPSARVGEMVRQFVGDTDATNLAEGARLAMAVAPEDTANRIVLISDGNETAGSMLAAAEAARARGVPIDVLPVDYDHRVEIVAERLIVPANARVGETINLRMVVVSSSRAMARLTVTENGRPLDLDPGADGDDIVVELRAGRDVLNVPVSVLRPGPTTYEAILEPLFGLDDNGDESGPADVLVENNRAVGVTFVGSEGAVLVVTSDTRDSAGLVRAMERAELTPIVEDYDTFPANLTELNRYDAVVLVNQPAYNFSLASQEDLRRYVHDSGGGLLVVGGPDALGAGGWIGSPLEDALPVRLDPPQKRQMPRGALVLVVHSVEMPQGVYYGKEVSRAAVKALSRLDLVGIVEFQNFGGTDWVYPIAPVGDGRGVSQAINRLVFGDMPSFDPSLQLTLQGLKAVDAGQKHTIVISDGDPSLSPRILDEFKAAGISISTVGVFPHSQGDYSSLQRMASETGGTFYPVDTNAALSTLPQIFIKEAQTVKRALIWEGDPVTPTLVSLGAETMRGISGVPPISGYVVTADREGLSQVTLRGPEQDPILAQWQHGLGRVVTLATDAAPRWAPGWDAWADHDRFWAQHTRWAMRPSGSASLRLQTEPMGDRTRLVVEAFEPSGDPLNFAAFRARASTPSGEGVDVSIRQVGPGRYEGVIDSGEPGSYVVSMRYRAPSGDTVIEGSAQAAVTRPFADEFRALESNRPLLTQVAQLTGGRVLTGDAAADGLWLRDGLDFPVATRAIWLMVALIGIGVFLLDVAVRRVRFEPAAIGAWIMRALGAGAQREHENVDSLIAAKAKARARLTRDDPEPTPPSAIALTPDTPEAQESQILTSDESAPPVPPTTTPRPDAGEGEESGISRLRRAKERARDEYTRDQNQPPPTDGG